LSSLRSLAAGAGAAGVGETLPGLL